MDLPYLLDLVDFTDPNSTRWLLESVKSLLTAGNVLDLVVKAGVLVAALFALHKWKWEQKWKRIQFAVAELEKFRCNEAVKTVCQMLDWNRHFMLRINPEGDLGSVMIKAETIQRALRIHSDDDPFTATEMHIRDIFDEFFSELSRINSHITTSAIDIEDVRPHLHYWVTSMTGGGPVTAPRTGQVIQKYLTVYKYNGVLQLVERFKEKFPALAAPNPEGAPVQNSG